MLCPTPLILFPTVDTTSPANPPAVATVLETVGRIASDTLFKTQPVAISNFVGSYYAPLVWDLAVVFPVFGLLSFSFGGFFFGAADVGADLDPSSLSVTSSTLGVSFSLDPFWNLVVLILGRGGGLGVELAGKAFGLGGSFGACRIFHAGLALGAPCDLVTVMLAKSKS